ncbi:MAG TPA: recombination mediator RecR [Chitinophagales bacterium]|nr:recombination mediator RecR [Chitinophagales bacterium]
MNLPSQWMEQAVNAFAKLPGIGKKTALRLVLHLLKQKKEDVDVFASAMLKLKTDIHFCPNCNNISDLAGTLCTICSNNKRDHKIICVIESLRDLIAIESTNQFFGEYHILGGVISPMEGIGPEQLFLEKLIEKANSGNYNEIIMALNPNIEGDTTIFYITKKITNKQIKITTIARGISFGGELEYTDELTLARSLATRRPFENYMQQNE